MITKPNSSGRVPSTNRFGLLEKAELLRVLDYVGVYARANPFPDLETTFCLRSNEKVFTLDGRPVGKKCGSLDFVVLKSTCSNSNHAYALVDVLKKAIYGSVQRGIVLSSNANGSNVWDQSRGLLCHTRAIRFFYFHFSHQHSLISPITTLSH
jgi:hypothetical protein